MGPKSAKDLKVGMELDTSCAIEMRERNIWTSGWIEAIDQGLVINTIDFQGDKARITFNYRYGGPLKLIHSMDHDDVHSYFSFYYDLESCSYSKTLLKWFHEPVVYYKKNRFDLIFGK